MRRLLIVDDEPRQRRGLARLVRTLRPGWLVLEAANGQEALDMVQAEHPDTVLSDIHMPMIDGFSLAERLQAIQPEIVLAYVSAYEEFNYAARALRLGAVDYLLKPYTAQQVEKTLQALEQMVNQRRETQQVYRQLDSALDAWKAHLLAALLTRALTGEERAALAGFLPLEGGGCVLLAQMAEDSADEWGAEDALAAREQLRSHLVGLLPELFCCALTEEAAGLAGVYIGALLPETLRAVLAQEMAGFPGVTIALSDAVACVAEGAERAYKQARAAAGFRFYLPEGGILLYQDIAAVRANELPYLFRFEQALQQKLLDAEADGLDALLEDMFAYLNAPMRYTPDKLLRRLYQVAQSMLGGLESRLPEPAFTRLWTDMSAVFSQLNTYAQLCEDFRQLMHEAIAAQTQERSEYTEEHIQRCIAYIREHIAEPLSLSELGERFYFSPNYLSALIKSRTGTAFKQYLQTLRMEAALERLQSSDDKVADIARIVGFPDPAYFNRIFKKQYGVSPDSYRRTVKSRSSSAPVRGGGA